MSSIHQTQVNLDGLLEILGKNLYSTPSVALRELIQNAHDACERYVIETGQQKDFRIELETAPSSKMLTITDNGSGLTDEEIRLYLATVGSGYTRILRDASHSDSMIGYFGLGFLSAYVVAEKVEVFTTSYKTPNSTWLFSSLNGKTFSVTQAKSRPVGTQIKLYLSKDYDSLADEAVLYSLIGKYCCLLHVPIRINGSSKRANHLTPPWLLDASVSTLQKGKKSMEFACAFESSFEPICCIPLPEDNELQLHGLLWIQDGSTYGTSDNRNISVFVRGMFITNEILDIVPVWAGFVGGVFESIRFRPTASRESLQKDEYFRECVDYVREQLIVGLKNIADDSPESWRRILLRHNQALLGAAIADDTLFELCKSELKVPSSIGDIRLPQLIRQSGGTIYVKQDLASGYEETLFKARRVPIVSGYLFAALAYCRKYGSIENVRVRIIGDKVDEQSLLPDKTPKPAFKQKLEQIFHNEDEDIVFTEFSPADIPLLVFEDHEVKLKKRIEQDEADKRIASAALSLARMHTKTTKKTKERRLYINLSNALICSMETLSPARCKNIAVVIRAYMDNLHRNEDQETNQFACNLQNFNNALLEISSMGAN